jgi:hypothetical protein
MTRTIAVTALALAVTGCASTGSQGQKVAEADVGRLGPSQMALVDEARQYVASARDELNRSKLRLQDSQHELVRAEADQQAAGAVATRAEVENKLASESRDPAQLERARRLQEQAQLQKAAADAHVDYAKRLNQANEASLDAANQQVQLAEARLEWSKLQAMQQASIPAASKYEAGKFQSHANDSQKSFDGALKRARELHGQADASQQRWRDAQRRLQARGGAIQTG